MINLLIVDDHPLFRLGICAYIEQLDNYTITAQASNGEEALKYLSSLDIDVVLLDVNLPELDGFELLSIIRHQHRDLKIVMLTMHDEVAYAQRAFELGANAYLIKDDAEDLLAQCLQCLEKGEQYSSLDEANEQRQELKTLSEAERHIFSLVSSGKSSYEIADLLSLSVRTVDNHRSNIAKKLDLRGPNALLKYAIAKNV